MQVHRIPNNNFNTTSFKAKLSLELIKSSETRWQTIASEFGRMTKKYKNDKYEFIPKGSLSKGLNLRLSIDGRCLMAATVLKPKMTKSMAKMSDTEIANKLKKLFALWVELLKIYEQSDKLCDKLFDFNDDDDKLDINALNYVNSVNMGLHNRAMNKLQKDPFFKNMMDAIDFPYFKES